jgi:replicative DNA helicase
MYRDAYYNPDTDDKNICELIVLKHRNGPTGTVKMRFDEKRQWFADLSDRG